MNPSEKRYRDDYDHATNVLYHYGKSWFCDKCMREVDWEWKRSIDVQTR